MISNGDFPKRLLEKPGGSFLLTVYAEGATKVTPWWFDFMTYNALNYAEK